MQIMGASRPGVKVANSRRLISAATRVDTGIVALGRAGEAGLGQINALLENLKLKTVPLTAEHARIAIDTFPRFGKGRHAAGLNFGDCFSYALAHATGEPLLFKGNDFSQTDTKRAV